HREAVLAYSNQISLIGDEASKRLLEEKIDDQLDKIANARDLQDISANAADPISRAKAGKRLSALLATKSEFIKSETPNVKSEKVTVAPIELGAGSSGSRQNIGVVLPLSGKFAPYGKRALEGILLASKTFDSGTQFGFSVFVEDSSSSPAMAQAAVESLYSNQNAIAVIGPLNFKEALAVGEKSQELGLVNLSLASKFGVSVQGPYVFQNALTPQIQLENLVKFSVADKGLRRFAILAPSNAYGKDMANEFWNQVEARGGKVVAAEFYPPSETDFQDQVKSMIGINDPRYRKAEWTALQDYSKEQKATTGKDPKVKLKPIIDFEAVFLPDSPKTVAAIAANLAYFDVSEVALLGTTEWNSDQLYKRGGRFVEKAIFPGVMNPITRSASQREFIRSYQEAYGNQPDLLAAQGYEAMILIGEALQKSQSDNRAELAKQLASLKDFETPIGVTTFDENRISRRSIPLYSLDKYGNIVEQ
ncbi:MAG: penicillin-binding protein activator, partial [Proteobacteria bacterium]|nr:penicillin-binding protein activator [Pseudomonadota bacterium]NDD04030.1 penicillin-binding protein activator [Pseudomonadota bacterium]